MKNLVQISTPNNLLLNLLVREQNNWYFMDIVPRYDDHLRDYMQSCEVKDFIRFDVKDQMVYIPISYKSLTGMHVFVDNIGIRKKNFREIDLVSSHEAILFLLQEIYPISGDFNLDVTIKNISNEYADLIKNQILNFGIETKDFSANDAKQKFEGVFLSHLFNEYSSSEELKDFLSLLTKYSDFNKQSIDKATITWFKNYIDCLFQTVVKEYTTNGRIVSPNLYNSKIILEENNQIKKIEVGEESKTLQQSDFSKYFNYKKIEGFLQTQLLTFHLFPLIRAIGLLKIVEEKDLIKEVDDTILNLNQFHDAGFDFILHHKILVDNFLPIIFNIKNSECAHSQKQVHNHLVNYKYYAEELIKPSKDGLVHKRYFENSSMEIGIRAFNIETDLEILFDWVNQDYAKKFWEMDGPIEQLEEAYIKHLGVDYSHPYIGTLNGEPIFTLELYWAIKDEVGKYYPFHPGDYGFHMLIAPAKKKIKNFSYYALTMCMEHFFSYNQVKRMIGEASVDHQGTHNLITKVGCEFDKALKLPYKTSNLTFLNREMYQEAVEEVLENSCTDIYLKV